MIYRFSVPSDLPELGLLAGDIVTYDTADPEPFELHRELVTTPGTMLAHFVEGQLTAIGPCPPSWQASRRWLSAPSAPRVLRLLPEG